jgi:hypothetical protein
MMSRSNYKVLLVVIGVLAGWYGYVGQGHIAYTMDSLTYRDVALNVLQGNGLSTSNTFGTTPARVPLLQWPPAYPVLWAAMAATGINVDVVPQVLSPLLYVITLALLFWIGLGITKSSNAAAVMLLLFTALPTGLAIFSFAWSETLFIPLILGAFLCLLNYAEAYGKARVVWLGVAALCIGLANWTRYTGVIFLLLLPASVLFLTEGALTKRLTNSTMALGIAILIVCPLWIRNFALTGMISGSDRGGYTRLGATKQLSLDLETLWNMVVYPLFSFDTVLYWFLGPLFLALTGYVVWNNRKRIKMPGKPIFLTFSWAFVILAFLLFARVVQRGVDFDYRMLAIPAPFVIVAMVALLVSNVKSSQFVLLTVVVALMSNSMFEEGQRLHKQIAHKLSPGWRHAAFLLVYRDLHKDYSYARNIKIPAMLPNAAILTDYRGLFIRYLTGHMAYQVTSEENCNKLKLNLTVPIVYMEVQQSGNNFFDNRKSPTARCAIESL